MARSQRIISVRILLFTIIALRSNEQCKTAPVVTAFSISVQQERPTVSLRLQQRLHSMHRTFTTNVAPEPPVTSERLMMSDGRPDTPPSNSWQQEWTRNFVTIALGIAFLVAPTIAMAENELSAKYGSSGFDASLVDQTCLLDHCSLQAKACLQDDPNCRKGLTCTAKCLGDNACITGCMARYGDSQLDSLLKCTIEDHECIKVAILPGGSDVFGEEPKSPAPTIANFDLRSMQGSWYKVAGYNPNYDCYACQRNTFNLPNTRSSLNTLQMDVEFSMPHLLPDGSPLPPSGIRETFNIFDDGDDGRSASTGLQSMALNDYHTNEIMIFDQPSTNPFQQLVLNSGTSQEQSYARTAHSEGEMFGLKFWENWYIIGENDKDTPEEFKFVYYNGKTRQNTYEGAFVYSRTKDLSSDSMKKVYQIAQNAGMDPDQFCRIRNGCFTDENTNLVRNDASQTGLGSPNNPFRGILASTRISELLGVEPVAARDMLRRNTPTAPALTPELEPTSRQWWYEVGDYLENPHRHFEAMSQLRQPMVWPKDVVELSATR